MKKIILQIIIFYFIPILALAASPANNYGIGGVANNIMEPVTLFSDFIYSGCILIGGSFLFASIIKYFEHRSSPLMVPMSTVVFLFIAGLVLVLLPLLTLITGTGLHYSLMKS